ncbi:MAG: iron export ABC transporter permease subunit FetB [Erysipelotrichaceae bacterium]
MKDVIELNIIQFLIVYLLLIIVLAIMKKAKVKQSKQVLIASFKMSIQLVLAGFILTYIFKEPKPIYVIIYLICMCSFAIHRIISKNSNLNIKFKRVITYCFLGCTLSIVLFFITIIVGTSIFNPIYTIPLSGMIIGNAMNGVTIALKTFNESIHTNHLKIDTLLAIGASPKCVLLPFVSTSLETALLPTMNSMLGMGIISLPGMMSGQILAGTLPMTAILYQIAIMIAITCVVTLTVFSTLYLGYRTLYNKRNQITIN